MTTREPRVRTQQNGGAMAGLIAGLVLGIAIALIVALAITKGPIPFVNKVMHNTVPTPADTGTAKDLPDPNKSRYSKDTPIVPLPSSSATAPTPSAVTVPAAALPPPDTHIESPGAKSNYLQIGAYKNMSDADSMKAKVALLGFEALVSPTTRNGEQLYRVRLGPYSRIDDMNRVRERLVENGIEAAQTAQTASASRSTP